MTPANYYFQFFEAFLSLFGGMLLLSAVVGLLVKRLCEDIHMTSYEEKLLDRVEELESTLGFVLELFEEEGGSFTFLGEAVDPDTQAALEEATDVLNNDQNDYPIDDDEEDCLGAAA